METSADTITLVVEAQRGSRTAFATLVQRYQTTIRLFVARRMRDANVADDIAQNVFLVAYQQLLGLKDREAFEAWLYGIARNQIKMYVRSEARRIERSRRVLEDAIAEWQNSQLRHVMQEHDDQQATLAALRSCIDELPPQQHRAISAFYFDKRTTEEIAVETDRSPGSVRMMMMRIRQGLASCVRSKLQLHGDVQ